mmetsp:Transcript_42774/g.103474  ORF Transcript_42774/g.103474 Transcript_42774/m.103474 type:complete len:423 (+) Transcript_42774:170-1438(+)|eukprot:CAMPEP_0113655002 /NCGR_PEP_ID=MMETSP0017_2-20120614/29458_1 /TAXON_ID=2856 /ORGANISM="Cylindrotheca closterium" /LENGTH=422 /DNA_ID=CAMNT_0000568189 /DNA_START=66 /DNA_END=1334 /DNA_ORIENTATION=- /assembly_acc=CAM_ASM_000147
MTADIVSSKDSRGRTSEADLLNLHSKTNNNNDLSGIWTPVQPRRHNRVYPERRQYQPSGVTTMGSENDGEMTLKNKPQLSIDTTSKYDDEERQSTPSTVASTPRTPHGVRGSGDLRSPGEKATPVAQVAKLGSNQGLPDFITQTDANGNAITPRSSQAIQGARKGHPSGPKPRLHVGKGGTLTEDDDSSEGNNHEDPCESLFENLRMMCCCLMDDHHLKLEAVRTEESDGQVKLLGNLHPEDTGKMCLVLDLDETLVHSSFRPVANSDFVIPVEIEDVTHLVYVAKRPGVDEFLVEMAKHYEIVIYTASLNKYADPLLDLLDTKNVIRTRLFRESCVYYEGNYVKDLSLLNRELSQTIIIDNSPASYMFHPENAIDCTSWIEDRSDRELDQIGAFLAGIKDAEDVRGLSNRWREWPTDMHDA